MNQLDSLKYTQINLIFITISAILTLFIIIQSYFLNQQICLMNMTPSLLSKIVNLIRYIQIMGLFAFLPQLLYSYGAGLSLIFDLFSLIAIMNLFEQQLLVLELAGRKTAESQSLNQEEIVIKIISEVKEVQFLIFKIDVSEINLAKKFLNNLKNLIPICLFIYFVVESIHFIFERTHSSLLQERIFLIALIIPKFIATIILIIKFKQLCSVTEQINPTFKMTLKFRLFLFIIKIKLLQTLILGACIEQASYMTREQFITIILNLLMTIELTIIIQFIWKSNFINSYDGLNEINDQLTNQLLKNKLINIIQQK